MKQSKEEYKEVFGGRKGSGQVTYLQYQKIKRNNDYFSQKCLSKLKYLIWSKQNMLIIIF